MARVKIEAKAKKLLRNASRQAIANHFIMFPARYRRAKWLNRNNRYREDCIQQYAEDLQRPSVNHDHLCSYIAASGPAHVIDAWSFVGRAVDAILRRDSYSAIHFGYYAELRSAMGLLACEGVGILDSKHPVVEQGGNTKLLPKIRHRDRQGQWQSRWGRTHAIVGPCLLYWSTLQRAEELLDGIVAPGETMLSEWLTACGARARAKAIAKGWLMAWGVDLWQIDRDHDARNLASYRPSEFRRPEAIPLTRLAEFIRELWKLFEPSAGGRFAALERQLLRRALRAGPATALNAEAIAGMGFSSVEAQEWATFLSGTVDPEPLRQAEGSDGIEDPDCPLQVISRAALLAYVATSAAARHLRDANYSAEDLGFWWRRFGVTRGLWDESNTPDNPSDAWADVQASLEDIEEALQGSHNARFRSWRKDGSQAISQLGAWELVAVWGLLP